MDFLQLTSTSIAISTYLSSFPLYMLIAVATIIVIGIRLLSCNPKNWKNSPPGPSGWPILGSLPQLLNKRLHEEFLDLSKIHGPLFSLKLGLKPAIVISSPEMVSKTLRQHEAVFSSRTVTEAIRVITYDTASIVYAAMASPRWRVIRKILTEELFSRKAFEDFEPVRKQQVHGGLLKHLYSTSLSKNSVNIAEVAFVASGNIVSNTVCSKSLFDSTKKQGRELKHTFWELMQILGSVNVTDLLPIFKPFDPQGLKRRILKIFWRMDAFYENIIKERLEERETGNNIGKHKLDLLDVLLDYRSDKEDELKRLSRNNIKAMLAEMFIAGTETTSSTVEWGMTEILRNPNVYKKVLMELDQVVGNDRFVEERDISNLPYLQAAVKEVFRLHPAVPLIVPRRTNEACEVSGYHIPKDCIVFVNVWGMARDHTIWEEPCEFKPERFIGSSVDVKGQDFNLMPFGTGKRICVGMPLGQRMVHFYLAALLHAFEWECSLEILDSLEEKVGLTIEKAKSLVGIPKPRLSPSVYLQ